MCNETSEKPSPPLGVPTANAHIQFSFDRCHLWNIFELCTIFTKVQTEDIYIDLSSLSHHFQASLHWRSKLYSGAWWGTRSGHRYHILRILHPWQDFLLRLLNVTISSCCTLPGIGRNLRRNIVEHLQLKWNKCWHVQTLFKGGWVLSPYVCHLSDSNPSQKQCTQIILYF